MSRNDFLAFIQFRLAILNPRDIFIVVTSLKNRPLECNLVSRELFQFKELLDPEGEDI